MLTVDSVASFLLDRGLIDVSWIIDGDLTIRSAARRNRNLRVEGPSGSGFFIKQPDDPDEGGHETLRCEAAFYQFCRQAPDFAPLTRFVPRLVASEIEPPVLVIDLVPDGVSLWSELKKHTFDGHALETARSLGEVLGTIHRVLRVTDLGQSPYLAWLSHALPWVFALQNPTMTLRAGLSPANLETLRVLQTQEVFGEQFDRLSKQWRPGAVIHGDVRFENVVVRRRRPGQERDAVELWLVDWEFTRIGDPAWDLAGALQDYLVFWISSMPLSKGLTAEQMIGEARLPLAALQSATRALWSGYRIGAGLHQVEEQDLLSRAVAFSAVRLIQSAFEAADSADSLRGRSVLLLQISANLLADPERGQVQLYGIPPRYSAS
jgi:Phosphotransferase enzyme family